VTAASSTGAIQLFYAACTSPETMFTSRSGGGIQQLMQAARERSQAGYLGVGLLLWL
jgi:hypothetical protein